MATQFHYFTGKAKWARLREEQAKVFDGDDRGKFCTLNFYFTNEDEKKAFRLLKTRKQFRIDEETGEEYVEFRRYLHNNVSPKLGGPPKVVDKENLPVEVAIGNGSTVTVKISTYDSKAGKATRLEGVRIEDLVEYVREQNESEEEMPF
jgi:hypothetical protein